MFMSVKLLSLSNNTQSVVYAGANSFDQESWSNRWIDNITQREALQFAVFDNTL
jgi:hypothetical protein